MRSFADDVQRLAARAKEGARTAAARARTPAGALDAAVTVVALAYVAYASFLRFRGATNPWAVEGDWKQWIWHYWRYHEAGAFPPGHPLTDYAFAVQPPLWWAAMASLSHVVTPRTAAVALNVVSYSGAIVAVYLAVRARTGHALAVAAACLLVRDEAFFQVTAGGYPRSFGPTLVLCFLAAWLWSRHRAVLVVLVLMAAVYPSVVVPCGMAYGAWIVLTGGDQRVRMLMQLAVVGAIVAAFGLLQNFLAQDWWGPVVTLAEAEQMPALREGGRNTWVPLPPFWQTTFDHARQTFWASGHVLVDAWTTFDRVNQNGVLLAFAAAAAGVLAARRGRYPLQIPLLFACAVVSHALARELAFKLYLPHRVVQHTLPYVLVVAWPILFHQAATALLPTRRLAAAALALSLAVVPIFALAGDGLAKREFFRSWKKDKPLYEMVRATPIDAQFAGDLYSVDRLPLLGRRQVLVNFIMAHAFRQGYYAEIERRIRATYRALYATSWPEVVRFLDQEKVDYLLFNPAIFRRLESGWGTIFHPPRAEAEQLFRQGRGRHVLANPPEEAVALRHRIYVVVDGAKLKAAVAAGRAPDPAPPPPAGPGPADEDDVGPRETE